MTARTRGSHRQYKHPDRPGLVTIAGKPNDDLALEGCVATGATREEVERSMREAIEFHLDGLRREGKLVPSPHAYSTYVDVPA